MLLLRTTGLRAGTAFIYTSSISISTWILDVDVGYIEMDVCYFLFFRLLFDGPPLPLFDGLYSVGSLCFSFLNGLRISNQRRRMLRSDWQIANIAASASLSADDVDWGGGVCYCFCCGSRRCSPLSALQSSQQRCCNCSGTNISSQCNWKYNLKDQIMIKFLNLRMNISYKLNFMNFAILLKWRILKELYFTILKIGLFFNLIISLHVLLKIATLYRLLSLNTFTRPWRKKS